MMQQYLCIGNVQQNVIVPKKDYEMSPKKTSEILVYGFFRKYTNFEVSPFAIVCLKYYGIWHQKLIYFNDYHGWFPDKNTIKNNNAFFKLTNDAYAQVSLITQFIDPKYQIVYAAFTRFQSIAWTKFLTMNWNYNIKDSNEDNNINGDYNYDCRFISLKFDNENIQDDEKTNGKDKKLDWNSTRNGTFDFYLSDKIHDFGSLNSNKFWVDTSEFQFVGDVDHSNYYYSNSCNWSVWKNFKLSVWNLFVTNRLQLFANMNCENNNKNKKMPDMSHDQFYHTMKIFSSVTNININKNTINKQLKDIENYYDYDTRHCIWDIILFISIIYFEHKQQLTIFLPSLIENVHSMDDLENNYDFFSTKSIDTKFTYDKNSKCYKWDKNFNIQRNEKYKHLQFDKDCNPKIVKIVKNKMFECECYLYVDFGGGYHVAGGCDQNFYHIKFKLEKIDNIDNIEMSWDIQTVQTRKIIGSPLT